MREDLLDSLLKSQNPDGGWGYFPGKQSALEPTAYALMSLTFNSTGKSVLERAHQFLKGRQLENGGWPVNALGMEAEAWVSALVGSATYTADGFNESCRRVAGFVLGSFARMQMDWVTRTKEWLGGCFSCSANSHSGGWGWTAHTAKWVEPTCNALIFLNQVKYRMQDNRLPEVVAEAERMTYQRMCPQGGWNYGNAEVLGEKLRPYPMTTALALIALQNHASQPENQRSLDYLVTALPEEKSALSLCFSGLCLDLYGHEWRQLLPRLKTLFLETGFFGNLKTKSLALLLLDASEGGNVFRYASA
jgi:hypothetical protein